MRYFCFVTMVFCSCLFPAFAGGIAINVEKDASDAWTVTYVAESPVTRLVFVRTPNKSRLKRWTPVSEAFRIVKHQGKETVVRADKQPFSRVSFNLTPTYIPLPKEYAPFSPFSDGGMLFHSGRFFVCANACDNGSYTWDMSVVAPVADNIVVGGKVLRGKAEWVDYKNGRKIYVGPAKPVEDRFFVSVIDPALPDQLHESIKTQLPQLMTFFADKLGRLKYRPSLFASYSKDKTGRYGNQGGTLPGQVFMHWYGYKSIHPFDSQATYWFFAHEVAHLYQGQASLINDPSHAWIHEGAADMMAGLASDASYLDKRLNKAQQQCAQRVSDKKTYSKAVRKKPTLHYSCGLTLFHAIILDMKAGNGVSLFELWQRFNTRVLNGRPASAATFLATAQPYLSDELYRFLDAFIAQDALDTVWLNEFISVKKGDEATADSAL